MLKLVLVQAAVSGATLLGLGLKALIMRLASQRTCRPAWPSPPSPAATGLGATAVTVALAMIPRVGHARPCLAAGLVTRAVGTGLSPIYLGTR